MTDVLGYDIEGRPLRAQDSIEIVSHPSMGHDKQHFVGKTGRVLGVWRQHTLYGPMLDTNIPDERPDGDTLVVGSNALRKLTDDDRSANQSFEELIEWCNTEPEPVSTEFLREYERQIKEAMPWTEGK
jgi:hypothetical protein